MLTQFSQAVTPVKTAIIPVAGLGTRTFPASLSVPKNLLPAGNAPLIQHAVEECVEAGIEKIVIICNPDDEIFYRRHFSNPALEQKLAARGKQDTLAQVKKISANASRIEYVSQTEAKGLGDAIHQAKAYTGGLPFAVILPDDYIHTFNGPACLAQMVSAYHDQKGASNVIAVMEVPEKDIGRYGIMEQAAAPAAGAQMTRATRLVEKPKTADEVNGSRLAVIGRYILQPEIMDILAVQKPGAGNEIQLTDAIETALAKTPLYGFRFNGQRFDYGTLEGRATAEAFLALQDPALAKNVADLQKQWSAPQPAGPKAKL